MRVSSTFLVRHSIAIASSNLPDDQSVEHYFEMSHVDAEQALAIYRHFCKQTELVVEFLGVAKKLQNILNVPIPNLKHVGDFCCLNPQTFLKQFS